MSRYLLDTHALIWWWLEDPSLSSSAQTVMETQEIWVSAASLYEIANKVRSNKLDPLRDLIANCEASLVEDGFRPLPVKPGHAAFAGLMKGEHRDPFDRIIAGQAMVEDMTVITRDREIAAFGCEVLW